MLPREQEYVPVPVWAYPVLHVDVHELPLARLDAHVPNAPLVGAVTVHDRAVGEGVTQPVQPVGQRNLRSIPQLLPGASLRVTVT